MARKRMKRARPFENLMILLLDGRAITKEEIAEKLSWGAPRGSKVKGPKIYNISSVIWDIKHHPLDFGISVVVRSIREGKKVTAYQIVNVEDARKYLQLRNLVPSGVPKGGEVVPVSPGSVEQSPAKKQTVKA